MISNFCEDLQMKDISVYHQKLMESMGLPKWMNVACPFCNKELPLRSIRSVSLKFNPRNFGDIALEVLCIFCSKMDTLYFKSQANNMDDFIEKIKECGKVDTKPMIEEDMYKKGYNNVIEKMLIGEKT
jgi:hypothetical protein